LPTKIDSISSVMVSSIAFRDSDVMVGRLGPVCCERESLFGKKTDDVRIVGSFAQKNLSLSSLLIPLLGENKTTLPQRNKFINLQRSNLILEFEVSGIGPLKEENVVFFSLSTSRQADDGGRLRYDTGNCIFFWHGLNPPLPIVMHLSETNERYGVVKPR
jgi:hypothetical protein